MTERNDISNCPDGFDLDIDAFFSELDSVQAPESVKSSTLAAMIAAADASAGSSWNDSGDIAESAKPQFTAVSTHGKPAKRTSRARKIGVAAIAACLTVGCIGGGFAYATPSSRVLISNASSFELNVNAFGIVIGASASNNEANGVLEEADVLYKTFSESLESLIRADKSEPQSTSANLPEAPKVNVTVISENEKQARSLEESANAVLLNHEVEAAIDEPGPPAAPLDENAADPEDPKESDTPEPTTPPKVEPQEDPGQGEGEPGGDTPPISGIDTQEDGQIGLGDPAGDEAGENGTASDVPGAEIAEP